jgi:RNA polymerase sigma-70 factor, ECF subfamily
MFHSMSKAEARSPYEAKSRGPDLNDLGLIQRAAAGEQAALRALFERHHPRVFRFIVRLVRNDAVAEELSNEVFMEVWRNASNFAQRSSVLTWILSIAHNRTISSLRKRREETWDADAAADAVDGEDDPEVSAQKTDKSAVMRQCMERLSADHREVIDLVYYHEMSIAEVSEIVGIPENTVKTRMFHARRKLSELLKAAGVDRGWP